MDWVTDTIILKQCSPIIPLSLPFLADKLEGGSRGKWKVLTSHSFPLFLKWNVMYRIAYLKMSVVTSRCQLCPSCGVLIH